jgi:hypothetical protein
MMEEIYLAKETSQEFRETRHFAPEIESNCWPGSDD